MELLRNSKVRPKVVCCAHPPFNVILCVSIGQEGQEADEEAGMSPRLCAVYITKV